MGGAILGVLIGHILMYTDNHIMILDFFCRIVHTQGFIFLSGFGLYYSFSRNGNVKDFFMKRLFRLYIPFFLMALPFFVIVTIKEDQSLSRFVAYMTTMDFWLEGNYYGMWYVAISLFLYALYPFLHLYLFGNRKVVLVKGGILFLLMIVIFEWLSFKSYEYWSIICFGVEKTILFPIGAICGYFALQNIKIKKVSLFFYFLVMFVALIVFKLVNDKNLFEHVRVLIGIPLLCLLLDALNSRKYTWIHYSLRWLGSFSLEIYLLHLFIWWGLGFLTDLSSSIRIMIAIPATLLVCSHVHQGIALIESTVKHRDE